MQTSRFEEGATIRKQSFDDACARFVSLGRKAAIRAVLKTQADLWLVEEALNTPLEERIMLGSDWTMGSEEAIAECGARVSTKLTEQKLRLEWAETARKELAEFSAKMSALGDARDEEVKSVTAPYKEAVEKLKTHEVFRQAVLPKVDLEIMKARWLKEADFQSALEQLKGRVVAARRGLREPMRRAWQSAHSRKQVKLDFKPYLEQEGFADLLK